MSGAWEARMSEVLNQEQFEELSGIPGDGDSDLFSDVALLFLRTGPENMAKIGTALKEKNAEALARAAHTLKGSSSNLGAYKLSEKCSRLEQLVLGGDLEQEGLFEEISKDFQELESVLKKLVPA